MELTPTHLGLCVSDLDASLRFWRDGLGFETREVLELGSEWADALEVESPAEFTSHFIRKGALEFELLFYKSPAPTGEASRSRGQIGLTHLAFGVDDLDAALEHLVAHGGTVLETTRTALGPVELAFVADPDGTRIELIQTSA